MPTLPITSEPITHDHVRVLPSVEWGRSMRDSTPCHPFGACETGSRPVRNRQQTLSGRSDMSPIAASQPAREMRRLQLFSVLLACLALPLTSQPRPWPTGSR